jgi:hypothetical protein
MNTNFFWTLIFGLCIDLIMSVEFFFLQTIKSVKNLSSNKYVPLNKKWKFWGCGTAIPHWITLILYFISRFQVVTSVLLNAINITWADTIPNPIALTLKERFIQPVYREISFRVLPMKRKSRLLFQVVLTQTPAQDVSQYYQYLGEYSSTTRGFGILYKPLT